MSSSRVDAAAARMASGVISLKTIRRTGTLGLSTSDRCQAIASPSRSSSVASSSSSARASSLRSSATFFFLSWLTSYVTANPLSMSTCSPLFGRSRM